MRPFHVNAGYRLVSASNSTVQEWKNLGPRHSAAGQHASRPANISAKTTIMPAVSPAVVNQLMGQGLIGEDELTIGEQTIGENCRNAASKTIRSSRLSPTRC